MEFRTGGSIENGDRTGSVRDKLRSRRVPRAALNHRTVWVGPGRGVRCSGCDTAIGAKETCYDVALSEAVVVSFHRECREAWLAWTVCD
jgi:hypothetical protein